MRSYEQRMNGIVVAMAAFLAIGVAARAQAPAWDQLPADPNEVSVGLIQQDSSDCTNTTVKDDPSRTRGGQIWVTRSGGTTTVRVAMTVTPDTTYHFFLKCVRALGDIRTDSEGVGMASFDFQTSSVGSTYAFDMYPDGAPSGNKFQSLTVTFK